MDKFHQLASDCQAVVGVLHNAAFDRFDFVSVSADEMEDTTKRAEFVGLIGLAGLNPPKVRNAFAVELDEHALSEISKGYLALMGRAIAHVEQSLRGADWNAN
jgi:hypothetical protein